MTRLPDLDPNNLTESQQAVYDAMRSGPRGDLGLVGPFGIWARSPTAGNAVQTLGAALRFGTELPEHIKEVAICTVGVHFKAKFEFAAHRQLALKAGVTEPVLDGIAGGNPEFGDSGERIAYAVTRQLLEDKRVTDETFAEAQNILGENGVIELVSIAGYYCLVSMTLNLFQVAVPETMADPWPNLS